MDVVEITITVCSLPHFNPDETQKGMYSLLIFTTIWWIANGQYQTSTQDELRGKIFGKQSLVTRREETYKNQIKFPYGINYKFHGHLYHNLDRVWVVTAVPMPKLDVLKKLTEKGPFNCGTPRSKRAVSSYGELEGYSNAFYRNSGSSYYAGTSPIRCSQNTYWCQAITERVVTTCHSARWRRSFILNKAKMLRETLEQKLLGDLPNALPDLYPPTSSGQGPMTRRRRGIFTAIAGGLVTLATEVVSHFLKRKRDRAVHRSIRKIREDQNRDLDKIRRLGNDFIMYGKYNLNSTEGILKSLQASEKQVQALRQQVERNSLWNNQQKSTTQLSDELNEYSFAMNKYLKALEETHVFQVEKLIAGMDHLLKAITTLSHGRLPPEIITHSRLYEIVREVEVMLKTHEQAYEPALTRINQYYDMKLATFMVSPEEKLLIITFPVLIKPITLTPMSLYEIETVYVPVLDQNLKADTYTRVKIHKPYIALNEEYYIQLEIVEMRDCKVIDNMNFCEELFLMKHKSKHTCESALFYDLDVATIKKNCEFEYVYNKTVVPSVLDGGDEIILANMLSEKKLNCKNQHHLDVPLDSPQHSYTLVNRSILCNCKIEADYVSILSSLSACENVTRRPPLQFTINMAYQIYLRDIIKGHQEAGMALENVTKKGIEFQDHLKTETQKVLPFSIKDVRDPQNAERPTSIKELLSDLKKMKNHLAQAEKHNTEIENRRVPNDLKWLENWETALFSFTMSLAALVLFGLIGYLFYKHRSLKGIFYSMASTFVPTTQAKDNLEPDLSSNLCPSNIVIYLAYILIALIVAHKCFWVIKQQAWRKGFLRKDLCSIYLVVSSKDRFVPIKLMDHYGNIFRFEIDAPPLAFINTELEENKIWDILHLTWGITLRYNQEDPSIPEECKLPTKIHMNLIDKLRIRNVLKDRQLVSLTIKQKNLWMQIPFRQNARCRWCELPPVPIVNQSTPILNPRAKLRLQSLITGMENNEEPYQDDTSDEPQLEDISTEQNETQEITQIEVTPQIHRE